MRRGRGDTLTGGSNDVSPQWFTLSNLTLSAANTLTELAVQLPIQRLGSTGGKKSLIMEILKVHFVIPEWDSNPSAGGNAGTAAVQIGTISQTLGGAVAANVPTNIAYANRTWRGAFTATGSYAAVSDGVLQMDITDGAGHGVLVATDQIFMDATTVAYANPAVFQCRFLYRWKAVTLEEYIGIVQSQQ